MEPNPHNTWRISGRTKTNCKLDPSIRCVRCRRSRLLPKLLGEARTRPADCGNELHPPPWLDPDKYHRAQTFFRRNFLAIIVSNLAGLLCLLAFETILKVLVHTGKSSAPHTAHRRYLGTLNHLLRWYASPAFDAASSGFKSLVLVRRIHFSSHTRAHKSRALFTSQADMVVTQWAFFGLVLTHGRQLGIRASREEEESLAHFWRTVGFILGIDDEYNLGAGSVEEVRDNCHAVMHQLVAPGLRQPPRQYHPMKHAMLHGIKRIVPAVDPEAFEAMTKRLVGVRGGEERLNTYSRNMYHFMVWNFSTLLLAPYLGAMVRAAENFLLHLALLMGTAALTVTALCHAATSKINTFMQGLHTSFFKVMKTVLVLFKMEAM